MANGILQRDSVHRAANMQMYSYNQTNSMFCFFYVNMCVGEEHSCAALVVNLIFAMRPHHVV